MLLPLTCVCALALAATPPQPDPAPEPASTPPPVAAPVVGKPRPRPMHPTPARWALDAAITAGAGVPFLVLTYGVAPRQDPAPLGQPDDVGAIDRAAVGHYDPAAATASDALLYSTMAAPFVIHAIEAGLDTRRYGRGRRHFGGRYGTDALLLAQTLAINGLLTELLKSAVERARPLAHLDPNEVDAEDRDELGQDQADPDRARSFPSGHTSFTFAAATASAMLLTLKPLGRRRRVAIGLAWGLGMAAATTTGVLRIVAGKHYPTDVLTGAALGAGIGAAVPLAHLPRRCDRVQVSAWRARGGGGLMLTAALP